MEASAPPPNPVGRSNKIVFIILGSVLAVIVLGLIIFFATRTSEQEKALQAVCKARADISTRVDRLSQTTVTNFTVQSFKADIEGISADVSTIKDNEAKLGIDRKAQIKAANAQFKNDLTTTLKSLGTSLSVENAQTKLREAGQQLVDSYKQSLAPVDCTGVDISD